MPIEFACEECGSVLRVPDGSSGKRSRCPACKHEQEIPFVVDVQTESTRSEKLSIPCPKCQHHLVCAPELLGTRGQCKKCAHIFTISTEPVAKADTGPALVFHCPECNQLFEGRQEMRGRKGKCHVCKAVFAIKLQPALSEPTPATEQPALAKHPQTEQPQSTAIASREPPGPRAASEPKLKAAVPKSNQPIRFECSHCQGVMEVPGTTAGLETECPYCQIILTIPQRSTVKVTPPPSSPAPRPTHYSPMMAQPASTQPASTRPTITQPTITQPTMDPLGAAGDPFADLDMAGATNPYAASASPSWSVPAAYAAPRSNAVSVGNVLQQGFDALFPSCLTVFLHLIIMFMVSLAMWGVAYGMGYALRGMNPSREVAMYFGIGMLVGMLVGGVVLGAWFFGSVSRTALNAVRKKPLNIGDALNPGGGFGAVMLMIGGGILITLLMYLPMLINIVSGGALRGFEILMVIWILLCVPVMLLYNLVTCLAVFAGVDEAQPTEAIQTSASLVFKHFGTTLAVLLLSGLLTMVLAIPTLGLAYVLPIYMTASLYNLATK